MFAGDVLFQISFDTRSGTTVLNTIRRGCPRPGRLMQELASTRGALVATHLPFPSVGHVAVAGNAFRCVPEVWDY